LIKDGLYPDLEVVGVYSHEEEPPKKLQEKYGVAIMKNYDELVGKVDGIMITARHGDNHYKYAKPYIESGIPMFIDKPITINEDEALNFMRKLRENGVRITGGSSLKHADVIYELKAKAESGEGGATLGGSVRAPLSPNSPYGGFYFYAQHLVEMVCEVFGRYPRSVIAYNAGVTKTVVFRYDGFDVTGLFSETSWIYYAVRHTEKAIQGGEVMLDKAFDREFDEFYKLLNGGEQNISYDDFISPVFIMNAIERSLISGNEEAVKDFKV
jgi:predicted dehydrogenase